jgi:hypothetical protein
MRDKQNRPKAAGACFPSRAVAGVAADGLAALDENISATSSARDAGLHKQRRSAAR